MTRRHAHAAKLRPDLRPRRGNATGRARGKPSLAVLPEEKISAPHGISLVPNLFAYQRDIWERWILFFDTLRQRAEDMLAHERAGKPPLLDFDYELILDARRFEKPANYALLRITRVGDNCLEDCLDPSKPPVMVVDPVYFGVFYP